MTEEKWLWNWDEKLTKENRKRKKTSNLHAKSYTRIPSAIFVVFISKQPTFMNTESLSKMASLKNYCDGLQETFLNSLLFIHMICFKTRFLQDSFFLTFISFELLYDLSFLSMSNYFGLPFKYSVLLFRFFFIFLKRLASNFSVHFFFISVFIFLSLSISICMHENAKS